MPLFIVPLIIVVLRLLFACFCPSQNLLFMRQCQQIYGIPTILDFLSKIHVSRLQYRVMSDCFQFDHTICSISELNASQVDVLWHCLVCDSDSSDDTMEWFLQQAQSKEFHALDASALQYIFTEKVQCTSMYMSLKIMSNLLSSNRHFELRLKKDLACCDKLFVI